MNKGFRYSTDKRLSVGCLLGYGTLSCAEVSEFDLVPFFIFLFISFMRWIENDIAAV